LTRERLDIDVNHSSIEFAVTFAMNSIVRGRFRDFSGTIMFDEQDPTQSTVSVQIDSASIDTGVELRDDHLRSSDFLEAGVHHDLSFNSTRVETVSDVQWSVHGDLSMAGQTHPVTLDTRYFGMVVDATGVTRAGFVSEVDLSRSEWGIVWNDEQDEGVLLSDRVRISLYISAIPVGPEEESPTTEISDS
jgi:polyisoprenoid-binding protein YceI